MSAEVVVRRGGVVVPAEELTSADQSTITGDGTAFRPLHAVGGGSAVVTDNTLTGDGSAGSPLGVDGAALSGGVPVATDGASVFGNGTTGGHLTSPAFQWRVGVTWDEVYAKMIAMAGPKICLVEFADAGRVMTARAGDPTNLNDIWFVGLYDQLDGDTGVTISVEDGFRLASGSTELGKPVARMTSKDILWDFSAITSPIYTNNVAFTGYASINLDGGGFDGAADASPVVVGSMFLLIQNRCQVEAHFSVTTPNTILQMSGQCNVEGFFDDGGAGTMTVTADASCRWTAGAFGALFVNYIMHNYATKADGTLYKLSIDGGGNVIATAV